MGMGLLGLVSLGFVCTNNNFNRKELPVLQRLDYHFLVKSNAYKLGQVQYSVELYLNSTSRE